MDVASNQISETILKNQRNLTTENNITGSDFL